MLQSGGSGVTVAGVPGATVSGGSSYGNNRMDGNTNVAAAGSQLLLAGLVASVALVAAF